MGTIVQPDELQRNDGQEGRPAYVAYAGKVYDVSGSKMWREGAHVRRHHAGQNLTDSFPAAPHGEEVLERVKLVGELGVPAQEAATDEHKLPWLVEWVLDRHPHNIAVHFPIAYIVAVLVLLILSFLTGSDSFETASYYLLWGAVAMAPVAMVLGVVAWSVGYGRVLKSTFMGKIVLSLAFLIVGVVALTLRVASPEIFTTPAEPMRWVYFGLVIVMAVLVAALGWLGDVIMYGK